MQESPGRTHELLVFADARQTFAPDALHRADDAVRRCARWCGQRRTAARSRVPRPPGARRAIDDADRRGRPPDSTDRRLSEERGVRANRRSRRASGCIGVTKSRCDGSKAPSSRRWARPARSTPCDGRCGGRCRADTILDDVLAPMRCGAGRVPRRLQRAGARLRSNGSRRPRRSAAEDQERWRATSRCSSLEPGCCCRGAIVSGCSTGRTSSAGFSCRMR